jgi:hypothetical protein
MRLFGPLAYRGGGGANNWSVKGEIVGTLMTMKLRPIPE